MENRKPSEKILDNPYDGKEIIDEKNRVLKLRKPDILDLYDLMSALGDDAKNPTCQAMAMNVLYIGMIDGQLVASPKSYSEFRATLKRIGNEGMKALADYMESLDHDSSKKGQIEKAKK